jgi:hypothetical protein
VVVVEMRFMEWEAIAENEAEELVFRALLSFRQGFRKDQELSPGLGCDRGRRVGRERDGGLA